MRICIINGPNLNLLGTREPELYGTATLTDLNAQWSDRALAVGASAVGFQSNHEGAIVDAVHDAAEKYDALIINAGALTHYSYAVRDAVAAAGIPAVEVHISNIYEREEWRHFSVLSDVCQLTIVGRGTIGYLNAIDHLAAQATKPPVTIPYSEKAEALLDIRTPDSGGPHRVALLLHGGFWKEIWKRDLMDPMAVALVDAGWATVNVEYTRGPGSYAAATEDVADAVRWVAAHGKDYNLDPKAIVAIGHSAGGYLALQLAHGGSPISGALPLASVSDLGATSEERSDDPPAMFLGAPRSEAPRLWAQAELGGRPQVPVHMVHGMNDTTVSPEQSEMYVQLRGGTSPITIIAECDHMGIIDPHANSWPAVLTALETVSR